MAPRTFPAATAVLLVLLALPLIAARPILLGTDVGVATQGSRDEWGEPFTGACIEVIHPVRVTLVLLGGEPTDVLTLEVPVYWPDALLRAEARLGQPAVLETAYPTPCDAAYAVEGTKVANAAAYAVRVESRG